MSTSDSDNSAPVRMRDLDGKLDDVSTALAVQIEIMKRVESKVDSSQVRLDAATFQITSLDNRLTNVEKRTDQFNKEEHQILLHVVGWFQARTALHRSLPNIALGAVISAAALGILDGHGLIKLFGH